MSLRGGVGRLLFPDVLELGHDDIALRKVRDNAQFPAHGRHETTQRADVYVGLMLQLGDGRLVHLEQVREFLLRQLHGLAQFLQRHFRVHLGGSFLDPFLTVRRHLVDEILKWLRHQG
jgi:hypothetical protein